MSNMPGNAFSDWLKEYMRANGLKNDALAARRLEMAEQLQGLEADLDAIRTPAARQAIAGQIADMQAALDGLAEQIQKSERGGAALDPAAVLERARALRNRAVWDLPYTELQSVIARSLPALYVLGGQLVQAPRRS